MSCQHLKSPSQVMVKAVRQADSKGFKHPPQ